MRKEESSKSNDNPELAEIAKKIIEYNSKARKYLKENNFFAYENYLKEIKLIEDKINAPKFSDFYDVATETLLTYYDYYMKVDNDFKQLCFDIESVINQYNTVHLWTMEKIRNFISMKNKQLKK